MGWGAIIGAVAQIAGSALAARSASKSAGNAQKSQKQLLEMQIQLQRDQFNLYKPAITAGLTSLIELSRNNSARSAQQQAQSRIRDVFKAVNEDLAATGSLNSGLAGDTKVRAAERIFDDVENNLFKRQTEVASLLSQQGSTGYAAANALSPGIADTASNIGNLELAQGGAQAGLFNSLGALPATLSNSTDLFKFGSSQSTPSPRPTSDPSGVVANNPYNF